MTDPYQQNPGSTGPQYGPPGTGPDLTKPLEAQGQPQYSPPPDPYGQPQYGQPIDPYGQQPGGYPQAPYPGGPQGYNPNDPEAPWGRDPFGVPLSEKQKLIAGLLQIFLGSFGVGRFYLGYTGLGIAQLVVTILTCGLGGIWGLIDGIMILVGKVPDPQGRPLRD
ncbi:NINE protein [Nocardia sp. NBC_00508]|uniref:TM2 domain-containing protein n=1 Tax=Nocardia sp. NBC_00508 TaxID=2975992 RepID=UPI002E8063D2|nr:NINE protein [Nocardia sp. NBC_00508]WUD67506.1 NINE protein [Nocardia sp. NBC_00508]